jgi:hypothetical protein
MFPSIVSRKRSVNWKDDVMSLIQEALKRQQMELEGKLPPPPSPLPPSPPVPVVQAPPSGDPAPTDGGSQLPSQEKAEGRRITPDTDSVTLASSGSRHRVLPALATVLLVLLVLASAVVWALMYGLELAGIHMPWMNRPVDPTPVSAPATVAEVQVAAPERTDAAPVPVPAAVAVVQAPSPEAPAAVAAPPRSTTENILPSPVPRKTLGSKVRTAVADASAAARHADAVMSGSTSTTAAPPAQVVAKTDTPVPSPDVQPVPAPQPPAETADPTAPPAAAAAEPELQIWPDIVISGVLGNEQKGAAFINGKVVGVNETVQGVRILAIRSQSALLEYRGETRLVKVGQSVNRSNR